MEILHKENTGENSLFPLLARMNTRLYFLLIFIFQVLLIIPGTGFIR